MQVHTYKNIFTKTFGMKILLFILSDNEEYISSSIIIWLLVMSRLNVTLNGRMCWKTNFLSFIFISSDCYTIIPGHS